jgi:hypothetical protein
MGNSFFHVAELPLYCPKKTYYRLINTPAVHDIPDTKFFIKYGNLYIVDSSGIPKYCTVCGPQCPNIVELYQGWGDVYASYDGVTKLPMKVFPLNLQSFKFMKHYDVPNFGSILLNFNVAIYNPYKKISKTDYYDQSIWSSVFIVDGKLAVSCLTRGQKCIVVDIDGNIVNVEYNTGYSIGGKGDIVIHTQYGSLSASSFRGFTINRGNLNTANNDCGYRNWIFSGAIPKNRGSKTKPASREINYY